MKRIFLTLALGTFFIGTVFAQKGEIPLIGSKAPSFTAESTNGKITFPEDYGKKWKILMSHPQDFTPVCSSEISELAYMQKEFVDLNTQIAIVSCDAVAEHERWKTWLEGIDYKGHGPQKIDFPIIDDHSHTASKLYGMLHEPVSSNKDVRGVFVIDPNNIVRSINFYPMQIGRNMKEIERLIVALQTADKELVCTPGNWKEGDDVIVPRYPYTSAELAANPAVADNFYNVGGYIWFKKTNK
jgi:peroxiredoxin (alkyl hydroperoxide reductase subunit C)